MNYRFQDVMKLIIPGLYLLAMVLGYKILCTDFKVDTSTLKDLSAILVILIPFVGFVVGYFVECITAAVEHGWYFGGFRRPSKTIIIGFKMYPVAGIAKVKSKHHITNSRNFTNDKASEVLQVAKQSISDINIVEPFRNNAILARNIFGSHVLFTVIYAFLLDCFYKDVYWYLSIGVSIVFLLYWIHHNHVYVKYVLAEYAKSLTEPINQ